MSKTGKTPFELKQEKKHLIHSGENTSRREFLKKMGLLTSGTYFGSSLFSRLLNSAQAIECQQPSGLCSLISISLNGGAGNAAQSIIYDKAGQLVKTYIGVGLGKTAGLPITYEFGGVPFIGSDATGEIGHFLPALRADAGGLLSKTAFVNICTRARDDSDLNKYDIAPMAEYVGLVGNIGSIYSDNSYPTGVRGQSAMFLGSRPTSVENSNYVNTLLKLDFHGLNSSQKEKFLKLIGKLNGAQLNRALASTDAGLKDIYSCLNLSAEQIAAGKTIIDINLLPDLKGLWANSGLGGGELNIGTLVGASIRGDIGALNLGSGYSWDNHQGLVGRTHEDDAMKQLGILVGRIIRTANLYNKKVFIYVVSDGGLGVNPYSADPMNRRPGWDTDRGESTILWTIAFDPSSRPTTTGSQVGYFDDQAATSTAVDCPTGNSNELAGVAAIINYLNFNKRRDLVDVLLKRPEFSRYSSELTITGRSLLERFV